MISSVPVGVTVSVGSAVGVVVGVAVGVTVGVAVAVGVSSFEGDDVTVTAVSSEEGLGFPEFFHNTIAVTIAATTMTDAMT